MKLGNMYKYIMCIGVRKIVYLIKKFKILFGKNFQNIKNDQYFQINLFISKIVKFKKKCYTSCILNDVQYTC